MRSTRRLRAPIAAVAALLGLVVLTAGTGANADPRFVAGSSQRGPHNENYDPPIYQPTARPLSLGTPDNPLVRPWGVYQGLAEHAWLPYLAATPEQQVLLDKIVQRPKATWFGQWQPDSEIQERVEKYVELTTGGDPNVLVQTSIFRMVPWEGEICRRLPTEAEQASYKRWIDGFAAGVGQAHMAIIMQPDGPFVLCAAGHSQLPAHMIKYAVRTLSALPNTSVYIDGGAADWNRADPKKALEMLIPMGIRWARGYALNSTHYDSTARQVRYSAAITKALAAHGMPGKFAVINTAANGRPFKGYEKGGRFFAQTRACASVNDKRCVTLGIPPTVDVGNPQWGLPTHVAKLAEKYVDAYLWFGRPWLYEQRAPFLLDRALALVRSSPY
jgi:endoglucanase